jgi:hypothetical protein
VRFFQRKPASALAQRTTFSPIIAKGRRTPPKVRGWMSSAGMIVMTGRYRPELHYMRGPGPNWFERHGDRQ